MLDPTDPVCATSSSQDAISDAIHCAYSRIREPQYPLFDSSGGVHDLFKAWAACTPTAVAVEDYSTGRRITFAELQGRAEDASRALVSIGVRPGQLVPILTDRCIEMVVTVLAVLLAGAAYVPIDIVAWPLKRSAVVLDIVKASHAIVTSQAHVDFAQQHCLRVFCLDSEQMASPEPSNKLDNSLLALSPAAVSRHDLAYVIFTSGTTAAPKGVEIEHKGLIHYVQSGDAAAPFNGTARSGDRMLLVLSIAFDACAGVMFSSLCNGATLVLADPSNLQEAARQVTILGLTPSILRSLGDPAQYPNLRQIVVGGESPSQTLVRSWAVRGVRFANAYGPTETTCGSSIAVLDGYEDVSIGRPMPGCPIFIVDDQLRPVKLHNEAGEMIIGGVGVARGYYNDAERTSRSFIEWKAPGCADLPAGRYFRTGDFACWRPGGQLCFKGRRDHRVKNRGFLIDLEGEVEQGLCRCLEVRQAAACMIEGVLVALVTPQGVDTAQLRATLERDTPHYMIPNHIFAAAEMPCSSNGKVDPARVKAQIQDRLTEADTSWTPADAKERALAEAVQECLGTFSPARMLGQGWVAAGGDSLAALRLASVLASKGYAVSPQDILATPTLASLQLALREECQISDARAVTTIPSAVLQHAGLQLWQASDAAACSMTQAAMLLQLERDPTSYTVQALINVSTAHHRELAHRLVEAWHVLLSRHGALRTSFHIYEGQYWQVERTDLTLPVEYVELGTTSLDDVLRSQREQGFDISQGAPLLRLVCLTGADCSHVGVTVHHAIIDGISMALLSSQMTDLLQTSSGVATVPETSFIRSLATLAPEHQHPALAPDSFFADQLKNLPPAKELVLRPGPAKEQQPAHGVLSISSTLSLARLRGAAQAYGVTFAALYTAAWGLVLARYASKAEVCSGVVLSGRDRPSASGTVGCFVTTLPLRILVTDNLPEYIESVSKGIARLASYGHVDLSSSLASWRASHQTSALPFATALAVQLSAAGPLLDGVDFDDDRYFESGQIPFVLLVGESREGLLKATATFQTAECGHSTASELIQHWQGALKSILEALDDRGQTPTSNLAMLDSVERYRLLLRNQAAPGLASDALLRPLPLMIEDALHNFARCTAAEQGKTAIKYVDLDRKSARIGGYLQQHHHIGPDAIVAIRADGSINWLACLIAVLRIGAAILPIDTSLPLQRQSLLLRESRATVLLSAGSQGVEPDLGDATLVHVPTLVEGQDAGATLRKVSCSLDNLAFVIYTSGSTGTPKGVMVEQRGVVAFLRNHYARLTSRPGRRIAQTLSVGFDCCCNEVLATILFGSTLVLRDPEPAKRFDNLGSCHATMATPSLLLRLDPADYPNLDFVALAGEPVPQTLVEAWSSPHRTLVNVYGPSEATIASNVWPLEAGKHVSIGRPVQGVRIYIVDEHDRPCPTGVPGELLIAGVGVARGYLGSPDLTSRVFGRDILVPETCERVYRSGDYGYWSEEGVINLLGRRDSQVKIRGCRVDLGEVEAALAKACSGAAVCVVPSFDKCHLVAFVASARVDAREILQTLRGQLPSAAVPSRLHALQSLPLTGNQKVDRQRLAEMEISLHHHEMTSSDEPTKAPTTPTEHLVASIWGSVLGLSTRLSVDHPFAGYGGHSLLQIRLLSLLRRQFGVAQLPLAFVMSRETIADQAEALDLMRCGGTLSGSEHAAVKTPLWPGQVQGQLSLPEMNMAKILGQSADLHVFTVSSLTVLSGAVNLAKLLQAVNLELAAHLMLRARYATSHGEVCRWFTEQAPTVALTQADDLRAARSMAEADTNEEFPLNGSSFMRGKIISAPDATLLALHFSHLIIDGWSLSILLRGIEARYAAAQPDLSQKPSSSASYPMWAEAARLAPLPPVDAWQRYLGRTSTAVAAWQRESPDSHSGQSLFTGIPADVASHLRCLAGSLRCTLQHLLLVAVGLLIKLEHEQEQVVLGCPFANRPSSGDCDGTVGLFLELLPVVVNTSGGQELSLAALVERVRCSASEALGFASAEADTGTFAHTRVLDHPPGVVVSFRSAEECLALDLGSSVTAVPVRDIHAPGSTFDLMWDVADDGWDDTGFSVRYEFGGSLSRRMVLELHEKLNSILQGMSSEASVESLCQHQDEAASRAGSEDS